MYHLNEAGDPLRCKAVKGNCPYAPERHFETAEQAREAFEHEQETPLSAFSRVQPHKMTLSKDVEKLLKGLYDSGLEPYVVGGSVRDSILSGAAPKDIDIEVFQAESMDQLEKLLKKSGYRVDSVGKSFGVLKLQLKSGDDIDISLPRKDSKSGDGHRGFDVEVTPDLSMEDAAGRRDFTINALYYSHRDQQVKDPHGGLADYRSGELRHINEHFAEDPLRVLRGAQFAGRFKMKLAPSTVKLCQDLRTEFKSLANERLQTEFEKLLSKGDVTYGLDALKVTGWDEEIGLDKLPSEAGEKANQAVARAKEVDSDVTVVAAASILRNSPVGDRRKLANYMIAGDRRQRKAVALTTLEAPADYSSKSVKAWARAAGKTGLTAQDYYMVTGDSKLRKAAEAVNSYDAPQPDILTGARVLEVSGRSPGKWIGKLLQEASEAQDAEDFTDYAGAKSWLQAKLDTV